jgi:hypothetical protein
VNRHLYFYIHELRNLFSLFFEKYEFHSDNLLEYLRSIISIMVISNFVDNPNGIYEYDIDNEIIKIERSLFEFVFKIGDIF